MKPPMDHKIKRPNGPWIPASETDIRKTFEKAREKLKRVAFIDFSRHTEKSKIES